MVTELERYRLSVTQYHQMIELGVLGEDEHLELIDGEIFRMAPVDNRQTATLARLFRIVSPLGDAVVIWSQASIGISSHDAPEPDLALLRSEDDEYKSKPPTAEDVLLIVEIADSSLKHDRQTKVSLYAQHGIPEYWIVDISAEPATLTVYREPSQEGYRFAQIVRRGEPVSPQALPGLVVDTDYLLR